MTKGKWTRIEVGLYRLESTGHIYIKRRFVSLRAKGIPVPDIFKNTKEAGLLRARRKAEEIIQAHIKFYSEKGSERHQKHKLLRELIQEYRETELTKRRKTTQALVGRYLSQLDNELGAVPIGNITNRFFETWIKEFKIKHKRATYKDYQKNLQALLNWAFRMEYLDRPVKFSNPDGGRQTHFRVYTRDELTRLWSHMNDDLRDQFVLAYECAMRLREVLYLTWDRIDLGTGLLKLRAEDVKTGSKTGKGREFFVTQNALDRLRKRRARISNAKYVFPARWNPLMPQHENINLWTKVKGLAGIKGRARWHDIRHTAITHMLLEVNVPPLHVSEYAGVGITTIQKIYLHSKAEHTRLVAGALSIESKRGVNGENNE